MLSAQFGDPYAPGVVPSAVVVELTHLATLYHDDVMDEADVRRGVASANARWDNSVAVLTGDFLFARASQILADLGPEAVRIQAEAFERLVTGQILETVGPRDGRDPIDHYLDVIAGKTGSLIAVAGRFGALMSGADESVVDILTQYGERVGTAFQLADDVLDIASDSHESGKTPGTDLREGIPTLPVLHLRSSAARLARGPPAGRTARRRPHRRRPARRGTAPAARPPGAGAGPPRHRPVRRRGPRGARAAAASARPGRRWKGSATPSCTGRADPASRHARRTARLPYSTPAGAVRPQSATATRVRPSRVRTSKREIRSRGIPVPPRTVSGFGWPGTP